MENVILKANKRDAHSKSEKNKLRNSGKVLGVFYMKEHESLPLYVNEKEINPLVFTSDTHIISLKVDGSEEHECIIKDVQFDPITDRVIHFDLLGLTKGETFQLEVPVQLKGNPIGVKEGGIIQHIIHKLEIECLPKDIPQHIDIDITNLKIGDAIHVRDLKLENISFVTSEGAVIVAITHPKVEAEPAPAEEQIEGEIAQPELVGKGKEEKEEE
jgi:large subunit ribosomal protein L25